MTWGTPVFQSSYIRKGKYCPATAAAAAALSRSGYSPSILKWGGLESPGQRLISSSGKTNRIALFIWRKNKNKNKKIKIIFFLSDFFWMF